MEFRQGESIGRPALFNDEGIPFRLIDDVHISFGDVCRGLVRQQAQYGSRYVNPGLSKNYLFIGNGLRIIGDPNDYHQLGIHPDDVDEFVQRYKIVKAYESGSIDEDGQLRKLTDRELQHFHTYLDSIGAFASFNQ